MSAIAAYLASLAASLAVSRAAFASDFLCSSLALSAFLAMNEGVTLSLVKSCELSTALAASGVSTYRFLFSACLNLSCSLTFSFLGRAISRCKRLSQCVIDSSYLLAQIHDLRPEL